jgi:hypothetical protein
LSQGSGPAPPKRDLESGPKTLDAWNRHVAVRRSLMRLSAAVGTMCAMSIYRGWRPLCDDVQQRDVAHTSAADNASTTAPPPTHLRQAQPIMVLLPRTINWIASLPQRVQPHALAAQYARIANFLCVTWDDPTACRQYFNDLLCGSRPNRKGFPVSVLRELNDLQAYYIGMHDAFNQSRKTSGRPMG